MKNKNLRRNSFWQSILFAFFLAFLAYFIKDVPLEICASIFGVLSLLFLVIAFAFFIPAIEANSKPKASPTETKPIRKKR